MIALSSTILSNFMLPQVPGRHYGYIFLTLIVVLSFLVIVKWHWLLHFAIYGYAVFVPLALFFIAKRSPLSTKRTLTVPVVLKVWFIQLLLVLFAIIVAWQWQLGFGAWPTVQSFDQNISMVSVFSGFAMIFFAATLVALAQKNQKLISITLFLVKPRPDERLAIYGNTWLRRASLFVLLLSWNLSLLQIIRSFISPNQVPLHPLAVVISSVVMLGIIRAHWFYQWIQKLIKRWQVSFLGIMLICMMSIGFMGIALSWLLKPILMGVSFAHVVNFTAPNPLLFMAGFIACLTVPLAFLLANWCVRDNPFELLLASVINPLWWLLVIFGIFGKLTLPQFSPFSLLVVNVLIFGCVSYIFASVFFAKYMIALFGNPLDEHRGPMPRAIVISSLPIQLQILVMLALQIQLLFAVDILSITGCILLTYLWSFCLFLRRMKAK